MSDAQRIIKEVVRAPITSVISNRVKLTVKMYSNSFCLHVPIYLYDFFHGILFGRTFGCIGEQVPKCDFILSYKYSNYLIGMACKLYL